MDAKRLTILVVLLLTAASLGCVGPLKGVRNAQPLEGGPQATPTTIPQPGGGTPDVVPDKDVDSTTRSLKDMESDEADLAAPDVDFDAGLPEAGSSTTTTTIRAVMTTTTIGTQQAGGGTAAADVITDFEADSLLDAGTPAPEVMSDAEIDSLLGALGTVDPDGAELAAGEIDMDMGL